MIHNTQQTIFFFFYFFGLLLFIDFKDKYNTKIKGSFQNKLTKKINKIEGKIHEINL